MNISTTIKVSIDNINDSVNIDDYESDDNGNILVEVPANRVVCGRCHGSGEVDCFKGGITSGEWSEWDIEDREAYHKGDYSIDCPECHGDKVVDVPDKDTMIKSGLKWVVDALELEWEIKAEAKAEAKDWARYCGEY